MDAEATDRSLAGQSRVVAALIASLAALIALLAALIALLAALIALLASCTWNVTDRYGIPSACAAMWRSRMPV